MKKIIISVVFICSVIFINAQQKSRSGFNDYLENRGIFSQGQPDVLPKRYIPITPGIALYKGLEIIASPEAKFSLTLPDNNKVYILPQDNMPCIVPDMSQFSMPVAKTDLKNGFIPNGSNVYKVIPQ